MKLINETRRFFIAGSPELIDMNGIVGNGTEIKFPKSYDTLGYFIPENRDKITFTDFKQCEQWMEHMKQFKSMEPQHKTLTGVRTKAVTLSDDDFDAMQSFMVAPETFAKEDFKVFDLWLANNFADRDGERFVKNILESFNHTIVGKSLLYGHFWGPPGEGRFYKSRIEKMTIEQVLEIVGPHPSKKFKEHLEMIEKIDGGLYYLVPTMYMLADHPDIRKIEAGIISDVSIGFSAPTRVEYKNESGQTLWYEYKNTDQFEGEALEGSFVFLGSQFGAQSSKSIDQNDYKKFVENLPQNLRDAIADHFGNQVATQTKKGTSKKAEGMVTFQLNSIEFCKEFDPENLDGCIKETQTALDQEIGHLQNELSEQITALNAVTQSMALKEKQLADFYKALGSDELTVDGVKNIKALADEYKTELIRETVKYACGSGMLEQKDAGQRKAQLEACSIEDIKERRDEYRKIFDEKNPLTGQTPEHDNNHSQHVDGTNQRAYVMN